MITYAVKNKVDSRIGSVHFDGEFAFCKCYSLDYLSMPWVLSDSGITYNRVTF